MARVAPRVRLALAVAVGAGVVAGAWHLTRPARACLSGSVGRCSPALRAAHPQQCAWIAVHPMLVLEGPLDSSGSPSRFAIVRADHDRTFRLNVAPGTYSLLVVARGPLVASRPGLASLRLDRSHAQIGVVAPAGSWEARGSLHVGLNDQLRDDLR